MYVPGLRLEMAEVVAPPAAHEYVYGMFPPVGATVAVPLLAPLHVIEVEDPLETSSAG